jgi:hypothetical protein
LGNSIKTDLPVISEEDNRHFQIKEMNSSHLAIGEDSEGNYSSETPKKGGTISRKKSRARENVTSLPPLKFQAPQIISRSEQEKGSGQSLGGGKFVGKLLSSIDTRDINQSIQVLLPYGGRMKGGQYLGKNTIVLGQITYPQKGERIFITFNKIISSDGQEKNISGQALDSKDYKRGVDGEFHSETGVRVASTLGLTMLSGMTDVLTEKTALGEAGVVTPKANLKNALFHGVSQVTEMEAERQASELTQTPPYVTLEVGHDLIVEINEIQ